MITKLTDLKRRWASAEAAYGQWEQAKAARFSAWSVRRRWAVLVLLPTLVVCCGGTVVGVPVAWALRQTIEASRGAPTPDAAANDYLMALGYNNEDGLLPILDNGNQDKLLAGWRAYRQAMNRTNPPPARLDFGALEVGPVGNRRAEVTVDVSATWWGTDGRPIAYRGEERTWRFQAREDNGWQVTTVGAPEWCGGYVRLDACR